MRVSGQFLTDGMNLEPMEPMEPMVVMQIEDITE